MKLDIWNVALTSGLAELYNGGAGFDPTAGGGGATPKRLALFRNSRCMI